MGEVLNLLEARRKTLLDDATQTEHMIRTNYDYATRLKDHLTETNKKLQAVNDEIIEHRKGGGN